MGVEGKRPPSRLLCSRIKKYPGQPLWSATEMIKVSSHSLMIIQCGGGGGLPPHMAHKHKRDLRRRLGRINFSAFVATAYGDNASPFLGPQQSRRSDERQKKWPVYYKKEERNRSRENLITAPPERGKGTT